MNIINIEPLENGNVVDLYGSQIRSVEVTYKSWFSSKKIKLHPTNFGPTFGTGTIHWLEFVDDLGKKMEDEICKQLTNYFKSKHN